MNPKNYATIFLLVTTIPIFVLWWWNIFGNGAKSWEKGILKIHGEKYRIIAKPIVSKIASTLILLAFLLSFILLYFGPTYN